MNTALLRLQDLEDWAPLLQDVQVLLKDPNNDLSGCITVFDAALEAYRALPEAELHPIALQEYPSTDISDELKTAIARANLELLLTAIEAEIAEHYSFEGKQSTPPDL